MEDEIDDLEDQLVVLESVIKKLKDSEEKAERQLLLTQYIRLEDTILESLLKISQVLDDSSFQAPILLITERFNQLGSEYQESWTDEFWTLYLSIRSGFTVETPQNLPLNSRLSNVINLALKLRRSNSKSYIMGNPLKELDQMAEGHSKPNVKKKETNDEAMVQKSCKCQIF